MVRHFQSLRINLRQLALSLDVDKYFTVTIGGREFRPSRKRHSPINFSGRGVNRGRTVRVSIHREDSMRGGVVNDSCVSALVGACPIISSVFRSKIVTLFASPLLVKPRPNSVATATPCTPGVFGISPTTSLVSRFSTITWLSCDTKSLRFSGSIER